MFRSPLLGKSNAGEGFGYDPASPASGAIRFSRQLSGTLVSSTHTYTHTGTGTVGYLTARELADETTTELDRAETRPGGGHRDSCRVRTSRAPPPRY